MLDGINSKNTSLNFRDIEPIKDHRDSLRRGVSVAKPVKEISEDTEFPYKAFYGIMSKEIDHKDCMVEGMGRPRKLDLFNDKKSLFGFPEPEKEIPVEEVRETYRVKAIDVKLDPIEEEQINSLKEELSSNDIKSDTLFDYVKLAYVARKGLHVLPESLL
jgi:hypothetical protein